MHLKEGKIAKNLKILRVDPERLLVGLDGLVVLAIGSVEQAIHVPADVRSIVVDEEAINCKLVSEIEVKVKYLQQCTYIELVRMDWLTSYLA